MFFKWLDLRNYTCIWRAVCVKNIRDIILIIWARGSAAMVVRGLCVLCPLSRVATVPNYVPTRQFNCKAVQPTRVLALLCRLSPHVLYLTFLPYTIVLACKILFTCSPMNILTYFVIETIAGGQGGAQCSCLQQAVSQECLSSKR